MKNKIKSWQGNILLYILVGIFIIIVASYLTSNFGNNVTKSNQVTDSPNSINIIGDNINNITVNKLDIPKPEFKVTYQSGKKINENLYQTDIILEIISQVPLQKIQIKVIDPDVISIDARQNSMTSAMSGKMQSSGEGQASISYTNAFGSYVLTINTKKQETSLLSKINITYQ